MVTVTSATQGPPKSLFPVWQCGSSTDGFVTLGCITRDLAIANDLNFKWTDPSGKDITDIIQYPAMHGSGGYTSVSQARVKASDWDQGKIFKCEAKNSAGNLDKTLQKPVVRETNASLYLTTPIQAELDNGTATFICLASNFSPKTHTFKWTRDGTIINAKPTIVTGDKGPFTAISVLEITANEWTGSSSKVKCAFQQKTNTAFIEKVATYERQGCVKEPEVSIIPPSSRDMLITRAGQLVCKTDKEGFKNIKWLNSNGAVIVSDGAKAVGDSVTLSIGITFDEWTNGTKFTCEVENSDFTQLIKKEDYQRETDVKELPEVYLLAPPESKGDTVTLTCYVKDFFPKEVAVSWLVDDKLVENSPYEQDTTVVIERDGLYSVYSQLVFPAAKWENGNMFSCRVYHESIEDPVRLISRFITKNDPSPKANSVNLNLSFPQSCNSSPYSLF